VKKLFVFDLDGTLVHTLPDGNRGIPDYLINTVNRLSKKYHVIVATGRRFRSAMIDVQTLDPLPFVVVHNGSLVCDLNGKVFHLVAMKREDMLFVSDHFETKNIPQLFVMDGLSKGIDFCFLDSELSRSDVLQRVAERSKGNNLTVLYKEAIFENSHPVLLELATLGYFEELKKFQDYLTPRLPDHLRCLLVQNIGYTEWSALEVLPKHVSKWFGIQWVVKQLGIDHVVTVGDDENDMEMLANASFSIVMGHARPHVKEKAKQEVQGPRELASYLEEEFLS
jgi:hydroxymethylpyrimidine pyrophosphatase-like HAD family hydrolase